MRPLWKRWWVGANYIYCRIRAVLTCFGPIQRRGSNKTSWLSSSNSLKCKNRKLFNPIFFLNNMNLYSFTVSPETWIIRLFLVMSSHKIIGIIIILLLTTVFYLVLLFGASLPYAFCVCCVRAVPVCLGPLLTVPCHPAVTCQSNPLLLLFLCLGLGATAALALNSLYSTEVPWKQPWYGRLLLLLCNCLCYLYIFFPCILICYSVRLSANKHFISFQALFRFSHCVWVWLGPEIPGRPSISCSPPSLVEVRWEPDPPPHMAVIKFDQPLFPLLLWGRSSDGQM
jgi:hypothetical protein